ncbi:MAG: hypothetical protein AVDCRST_MAG25-448 [uncultured Rubrobacteraceae bacterium]|uniref:NERD domain-containing protein n=1 Tax=uncultured Rubrobacteraceae bacterium TaxID=349277 RepID=A0A6J4R8M9_9ACTN|nr:MAG: hypothetical protein AVDCRST_MAG25-448 [uncultured Rubrobacteraceae bacterium]
MDHWVMAFVGDHARENHEITRRTNTFCVSSNRTPIRRAHPGDGVLFYVAGEGFVARARVSAPAQPPVVAPEWSSKKPPSMALSVTDVQPFPRAIPYKFSGDGNHPILGFHRYALTGGFLAIPETGFEDVLGRAGGWVEQAETEESYPVAPARPEADGAVPRSTPSRAPEPRAPASVEPATEGREREKRAAGQHAMSQGRKQVALWTVAEMGASLFGIERARKFSRDRARTAEQTWLRGGRAEERVGEELEGLRAHGFYIFHDVQLPSVGNVDHVVLGEGGFFAIETKSHAGHVTIRGGTLLRNGRPFEKDFVKQAWSGCYGLREIVGAEVAPLLLFTDAFVEGRITARGVRVLPLKWMSGEILGSGSRHDPAAVKAAVARLSSATGCHPSAAPRLA